MADSLKRAGRTFFQAFLGTLLASWAGQNIAPGELPPLDVAKRLLISAAVAGLIAALSYAQNALEEATGQPLLPK